MIATLTVLTNNEAVAHLVGDFAKGLECSVDRCAGGIQIELPDAGDTLLDLLDYVALSATKVGIELAEPRCRLSYRRGETARVTLGLRLSEFRLD